MKNMMHTTQMNDEQYAEYMDELHEQRRRQLDREHNVITDLNQLEGWIVQELTRWKPGVVQYRATRRIAAHPAEQIIGYAKDEVFAAMQLPT